MEKNKKMISLEISNDLREALRRRAFKENTSISNLIRKLLEKEVIEELQEVLHDKHEE